MSIIGVVAYTFEYGGTVHTTPFDYRILRRNGQLRADGGTIKASDLQLLNSNAVGFGPD